MIPISPYFGKTFENKEILSKIDRILIKLRRKPFIMPEKNSSVILIASGGLDSVSLWLMLLKKYRLRVYPIYFDNGNRSQKESVVYYDSIFKKTYPDRSLSLTTVKKPYPEYKNYIKKDIFSKLDGQFILANLVFNRDLGKKGVLIPGAPTRLFYFNVFAFEFAHLLRIRSGEKIDTVFTGIVPDDSLTRRESTLTTIRAINLATILIFGNENWQCQAPLDKKNSFYFSKKDLVRYALKNGLDLRKTWSCDRRGKYQCGACPSCFARKKVFKELKIIDPTIYKTPLLESLKNKVKSLLKIKRKFK